MKWIYNIFTKYNYMPPEWEFASGVKTTTINMYILIVLLIVTAGWGTGVVVFCFMFLIDYIGILINRYRYAKIENEFKNYIMSGLTPCLVYAKSDPLGIMYTLVVDDKLSTLFAGLDAEPAFWPIVIFLSEQVKTDLKKKHWDMPTKVTKFYKDKIVQLPSCKPTDKNLAVIKAVLEYQKNRNDEDWLDKTTLNKKRLK